jgi:hypothetical protein
MLVRPAAPPSTGAVLFALGIAVAPAAAAAQTEAPRVLDDFETVAGWTAAPADGVLLRIGTDSGHTGRAMRLDFDFQGHGGYAVARKRFPIDLPDNYAFTFWIRADAPVNNLEFKLVDSTGDNVWWMNRRNLAFPRRWTKLTTRRRQIEFAWGPVGGGMPHRIASIELAITAGTGGKGTVWIDQLELEPRPPERPYDLVPAVTASTSEAGHAPALALDADSLSSWRSGPAARATLTVDFHRQREFGGMTLDWERGRAARDYTIRLSDDGSTWTPAYAARNANGGRDYIALPEAEARYVRLVMTRGAGQGFGLRAVRIQPLDWAATPNAFLQAVADDAPRGAWPRYLTHHQSYWTIVGVSGDGHRGLLGPDGAFEPAAGGFSVEPFVRVGDRTLSWADAASTQSLADGFLPIPSVTSTFGDLSLTVTAFAAGRRGAASSYTRYRVANRGSRTEHVTLLLALRPLQVNPPWQFLGVAGGAAEIGCIRLRARSVWIDGVPRVDLATKPGAFGAATFDEGDISELLLRGAIPRARSVRDPRKLASAALSYPLELEPGTSQDIWLRFPLESVSASATGSPSARSTAIPRPTSPATARAALTRTTLDWRTLLARVTVDLPPTARPFADALRSSLAYMLINRDGPAIEPGARSYRRSWIRDGAMIGDALLRMGQPEAVREFLDWFAPYQYADGKVPCCVDTRGADPVTEHDSHGELIYAIAQYYRATGDRAFLERMWPHVAAAAGYIDSMRRSDSAGIMPPSISHEGYSAKPVHSYWDDFFALRGLTDAADLAATLGHDAPHFMRIRDEFARDLHRSIRATISRDRLDYIPGSAGLGDYDPTSTSIGITPGDEAASLPAEALAHTYDRYLREVRARGDSSGWKAYTPYEMRNIGALVRLGRRADAWELLQVLFHGQRPPGWRQWPEVVYRDSAAPGFLGDLPHTWVASDYVRSLLDMLAYERESDSTLVLGAGIPAAWVNEVPGVAVRGLPIGRERISFTMMRRGDEMIARVSGGVRVPAGGILVYAPFDCRPGSARIDGAQAALTPDGSVSVRRLPAQVRFDLKGC